MDGLSLTIAIASPDESFRREVARICERRAHVLRIVGRLRDLQTDDDPDVLVLDLAEGPDETVGIARALEALHPRTAIVLVGDERRPSVRSLGGFRVVDRWRCGDRLGDEFELAYIGIPAETAAHLEPSA